MLTAQLIAEQRAAAILRELDKKIEQALAEENM